MASTIDRLFGPTLSRDYCFIFYILAVFQFIFIATAVLALVMLLGDLKKNKYLALAIIMSIVNMVFIYFYNRLLYTMCSKTL